MRAAVTYLDVRERRWREGVASVVEGRVRIYADEPTAAMPRLDGVVTGGFTDAHVHLQLVDVAGLAGSTLGRVFDLGGNPAVLAGVRNFAVLGGNTPGTEDVSQNPPVPAKLRTSGDFEVGFAGAFLTPPGGYPSDRAWAPAGSVREIADADAAASAIAEMKRAGASCIKIASNSAAGPVFTDEMFTAIVEIAADHRMPVICHAEGPGEAQRATRLRAGTLAHAPFSERLSDADLHVMRGRVSWISTIAIHDGEAYDIAVDNVRRFHGLGGSVVYGTDMGNGPTPAGLNPRELGALRAAGITGLDLLRALAPVDPLNPPSRLLFYPGCTSEAADPLLARPLTLADLEA